MYLRIVMMTHIGGLKRNAQDKLVL